MKLIKKIKATISQISAITENNLKLATRFKLPILMSFITPLLSFVAPLVVMGQIFTFTDSFGIWNNLNFAVYILTAYQLRMVASISNRYPNQFAVEKIWKTLHAIIIAPFNRINLIFGIFFTHFIIIAIPLLIFFTISVIILPISFITILSILMVYFLIALIFSGIGLFLGALKISKPSLLPIVSLGLTLLFMFSCLGYPFDFFPSFWQNISLLNPFFYLFDFIRALWIDNNLIVTIITHPLHVLLILGGVIVVPLVGLWIFNIIFKKYGIVGY